MVHDEECNRTREEEEKKKGGGKLIGYVTLSQQSAIITILKIFRVNASENAASGTSRALSKLH